MLLKKRFLIKIFFLALLFGQSNILNAQAVFKYTNVNPITNQLTITNTGNVAGDIGDYWLCLGPGTYQQIDGITTDPTLLSPGTSLSLGYAMNEANDGLSLFSTNSFGSSDPTILLDFVQWGSGNQARAGQGVAAGRWDNVASFVSGIAPYTTMNGGSAMAWNSCSVLAGEITFSTAGINNTTSVSADGTIAVICVDSNADPLDVIVASGSMGTNPGWIITDKNTGEILGLPAAPPFNLDGAGIGSCSIYYIRYEDGLVGRVVGENISDLAGCFDLSEPIDVVREAADGGTISLANGITEISICAGDGTADPLDVIHDNPLAENLSYRYVITNEDSSEILGISPSATIDLDGAGQGICKIWGWSYRGFADNGTSFIGSPLSDLQAVACSDISDNAITVNRLTGADCEILSVNEQDISLNLTVFPNPVTNVLNIRLNANIQVSELQIEIYSITGQRVYNNVSEYSQNVSIDLSFLNSGLYLMNIVDPERGIVVTKKIAKQ